MFDTPILFLIFNRPDTTKRVFEAIKNIRPKLLFIAADGPRPDRIGEIEKCEEARAIISQIDWECDVKTLFRENNLGCKIAVSSAITWFFNNVQEGIILEDDCVPSSSFFSYCSELLCHFRNDKRVMMISGDNFLFNDQNMEYSYFFSKYHFIWGWATWKRAWESYDVTMKEWPNVNKNHAFLEQFTEISEKRYWLNILEKTYKGNINTWDYQWAFTLWVNNGLTICPNKNLISNIGFDGNATHTNRLSKVSNLAAEEIETPLNHPPFCFRNETFDRIAYKNFFKGPSLFKKVYKKMNKLLIFMHG